MWQPSGHGVPVPGQYPGVTLGGAGALGGGFPAWSGWPYPYGAPLFPPAAPFPAWSQPSQQPSMAPPFMSAFPQAGNFAFLQPPASMTMPNGGFHHPVRAPSMARNAVSGAPLGGARAPLPSSEATVVPILGQTLPPSDASKLYCDACEKDFVHEKAYTQHLTTHVKVRTPSLELWYHFISTIP